VKTESQSGNVQEILQLSSKRPVWHVAAVLTAICMLAAAGWQMFTTRSERVGQSIEVPVPLTTYPGYEDDPAFSADGSQIAFSWDGGKGDNYDIYVKLIGPGEPLQLTRHPASESAASWSPDGRWITFVRRSSTQTSLILIPTLGGAERTLVSDASRLSSTAWSPDGRWVITSLAERTGASSGIVLVSLDSGERRALTSPPPSWSDY
jgi:Tol biopolymer transport system component